MSLFGSINTEICVGQKATSMFEHFRGLKKTINSKTSQF
jgi:hypothetical protein